MLARIAVILVLMPLLMAKARGDEKLTPNQNFLISPQWQQLLQGHPRWPEGHSDANEDYPDSEIGVAAQSAARRFLRATDLLKALSDKRNFITQIRQTRFKDSAYAPALTPSGRPYGTPLRWG